MDWKINPKTLEFENLSIFTWCELKDLCTKIVREGKLEGDHPAVKAWMETTKSPSTHALLLMATAFPQKALLSLADFAETSPVFRRVRVRCTVDFADGLVMGQEYWHLQDPMAPGLLAQETRSLYIWTLEGTFVCNAPKHFFEAL